ncbi:hypothetical protein AAFN75_14025 [Algibacter sp. AS12]|uniref:hypothetical protein n=1 Tax=Algibacter sp. AS12 TaxID=3135773 RepID=UPI00398A5BC9
MRNKNGFPEVYYMNVESVICYEQVCKIVSVKLFWNSIGQFQKYELEDGVTLEKYEADVFDTKDYIKLQSILANSKSPFKDVEPNEIITILDGSDNDVDAVSGATAIQLDEKDTVPGAALCCYTLWHYANGDIISIIREKTKASCKLKKLNTFLDDGNDDYKLFSLETLLSKQIYSDTLLSSVVTQTTDNNVLLRPAIEYIEGASEKAYANALKELFYSGSQNQKIASLSSLLNTKKTITKAYLDDLSKYLPKSNSYQEVSLLLRLMENKNPDSQEVIKHALPMLNNEFLIARRIYWFLKDQKLDKKQERLVKKFYKNNKNRL